jgi:hypothetical protein
MNMLFLDDLGRGEILLLLVLVLVPVVGLLITVGNRATTLGRNTLYWVILGIFTSPIIALLLLYCAGETDDCRIKRIAEEERIRISVQRNYEQL